MQPASRPATAASDQGLFMARLMSNPLAGISWADCVLSQGRKECPAADFQAALDCVCISNPAYSDKAWEHLRRARVSAMRESAGSMEFAKRLPGIWEAEGAMGAQALHGDAMLSWVKTMSMLSDYGVEQCIGEMLAQKAAESAAMGEWLASQDASMVTSLMDEAISLRSRSPVDWQLQLVALLPARACVEKLSGALFRHGGSLTGRHESLSAQAAQAMAAKALAEPGLAADLIEDLFMRELAAEPFSRPDIITGVFQALVENPDPFKGKKLPKKILLGSAPIVSLAMELICSDRRVAGLACAQWAAARGGAGRVPASERCAGEAKRRVEMSVRITSIHGPWNRGRLGVSTLQEAAIAMRDPELSRGLASLGWGLPKKCAAMDLAKRAASVAASAKKSSSTPSDKDAPRALWCGGGALEHAQEGTMAFWEARHLERLMERSESLAAPQGAEPRKPRPRI